MVKNNNRRNNFWERNKKETVLRWMATFTVTVAAAATIIVMETKEQPQAIFNNVSAVGSRIIYDLEILDPAISLETNSLNLYINSSLEAFKVPLSLGQNQGSQEMRYLSSEYTLSIKGSLGFGEKTLAKQTITSNLNLSGSILSHTLLSDKDDQNLDYRVDVLIYNKDQMLNSMWLRYGLVESFSHQGGPLEPYNFEKIVLTSLEQSVVIPQVPNYNYTIFMYLEGSDANDNVYLLDAKKIMTPTFLDGSLFIHDVGDDFVEFSYFLLLDSLPNQTATIKLYDGQSLMVSSDIDLASAEHSEEPPLYQEEQTIIFNSLTSDKEYRLLLTTSYEDLNEGVTITKDLYSETFRTAPKYEVNAKLSAGGNGLTLDLMIIDENNILSEFTYSLYDISGEEQVFLNYGDFQLGEESGNIKNYITFLAEPETSNYMVNISANKTIGQRVYYQTNIYTIIV